MAVTDAASTVRQERAAVDARIVDQVSALLARGDRIAAGETPPRPPRPAGVERNLVVTLWDWGVDSSFIHDEITTDKRNPAVNGGGPVYGVSAGHGTLTVVDPVANTAVELKIPVRPEDPDSVPSRFPQMQLQPSYYWGDQHRDITMGPDRAARMDACSTAERLGVRFAIHSDAPVTPLAPLFTAWCAVNRLTASGQVLGPNERITVASALHAITLGAAYTLKMDHLVGSIEPGKWADFAVLEDEPTKVAPEALKDGPVWGTVTGGEATPAARRA